MRKFGWLSVVVALCLVGVACGSRKSESSGGGGTSDTTAAAAAAGTFGTLTNVCGPGDAKGATAQGVTDTEIRVGTVADPGYTGAPGLDQELFDTAKAFSEWCNDAGGIQGRKIKVDYLDAALFNYKDRITEACAQNFSLVGGGAVLDDTGSQDRVDCGLPDIAGYVVSAQATGADLLYQPLPNPVNVQQIGDYNFVTGKDPSLKSAVGILTANFAATKLTADKIKAAYEKVGSTIVYQADYNPTGEANWAPFVSAMKSAGVKTLYFVGEYNNLVALQKSMNDQGWFPEATFTPPSFYDDSYVATGGATAKNTYMAIVFHQFAEASKYPAVQQYLDILAASGPKKKPAMLGMQAFSAWLMFAKVAASCGSNLTRDCLLTGAGQVSDWTGGGLHSASNPGKNEPANCVAVLQVTPTGFTQIDPGSSDGFTCSPDNLVSISIDAPAGAKKK